MATAVLLVAITAQVAFYKVEAPAKQRTQGRLGQPGIGGMTLVRVTTFIQWKPSIVSWAIALGLAGAQLFEAVAAEEGDGRGDGP